MYHRIGFRLVDVYSLVHSARSVLHHANVIESMFNNKKAITMFHIALLLGHCEAHPKAYTFRCTLCCCIDTLSTHLRFIRMS